MASCKSNEVIVYKSIANSHPHLITGAYLEGFFKERDDVIKYKLKVSRETIKKLKTVKDSLKNGRSIYNDDTYKYGIYYHATIYKKDTLYSSLLASWRYKNKTFLCRDIFIGNEFEKNSNR